MEKIVVVSSNNNPDYLFYAPYICKAWNKLGWKVAIMLTHDVNIKLLDNCNSGENYLIQLPEVKGLRMETVAQASRLYAANYLPLDALIMTSDMDLLPLQDYWKPDINDITVYGHDLTDYTYFPMGYTAMSGENWFKKIGCTLDTSNDMLRDCKKTNQAFSDDWSEWWNTDWQILTDKLKEVTIKHIHRGRREGSCFAFGRIDRGDSLKLIPKPWIDLHGENNNVLHPEKFNKFIKIFEEVYGKL